MDDFPLTCYNSRGFTKGIRDPERGEGHAAGHAVRDSRRESAILSKAKDVPQGTQYGIRGGKHEVTKRKLGFVVYAGMIMIFLLIALLAGMDARKMQDDINEINRTQKKYEIYVGSRRIDEFEIQARGAASVPAEHLADYIEKVSGVRLKVKAFSLSENRINIVKDATMTPSRNAIEIYDDITIRGRNAEELEEQVRIFANTFMGIAFAGEDREHVLKQAGDEIHVQAVRNSRVDMGTESSLEKDETPLYKKREPIICLWKTDAPRGVTFNPATSLKCDLLSYSDDQLYTYVKMMKAIGYTGIQVTDMCSAWAYFGNYEYVHDRIRFMADAAHSLGMDFTLWVWGAEFTGYGWTDETVDYYGDYSHEKAYDNPDAIRTFEKYYSIYAELADCCDRVIAHYNDPGNLHSTDEIAYFAKMLREKFRSVNPNVNFGVSCYTHEIDVREIDQLMGGDVTVYLGARTKQDATWSYERQLCRDDKIDFGIWSWNLTEQEIDQLAMMNVNTKLIRDVYQRTMGQDAIDKPSYWSEMDSYHVLNIFSHYCAANLLIDPSLAPEELKYEVSCRIVGGEYAEKMTEVLDLIEDARTGDRWETFKWDSEDYLLKSDAYDAADIMARAKKCLEYLDEMISARLEGNTIPLPMSVSEFLGLIKPHVQQIYEFAKFRNRLNQLYVEAEGGASKLQLQLWLADIAKPVSEYNVIVGVWGIPEARAQYELMEEFCKTYDLPVPQDPTFIYFRKFKIYNEFVTWQRKSKKRVTFTKGGFQWSVAYGPEETERLTQQLIDEGLLTELPDGKVYVTDWKKYRFDD